MRKMLPVNTIKKKSVTTICWFSEYKSRDLQTARVPKLLCLYKSVPWEINPTHLPQPYTQRNYNLLLQWFSLASVHHRKLRHDICYFLSSLFYPPTWRLRQLSGRFQSSQPEWVWGNQDPSSSFAHHIWGCISHTNLLLERHLFTETQSNVLPVGVTSMPWMKLHLCSLKVHSLLRQYS